MHFLLKDHYNPETIVWDLITKKEYEEIENILINNVIFFEPFIIDNFFEEDDFNELVKICNNYQLSKLDFSNQMNKWEEKIYIPEKFIDIALEKIKKIINTDNIYYSYHMYAHHQITEDGRVPKLPLHIDWAPGAYMIDLHIGGNRDWDFIANNKIFTCKPNQAIICQPQFDFHYRPSWNSTDPKEYYQALFFHLINKEHWSIDNNVFIDQNLKNKYNIGSNFRNSDIFIKYQNQKKKIFEKEYILNLKKNNFPNPPWRDTPSEEDAKIHNKKNVVPRNIIKEK